MGNIEGKSIAKFTEVLDGKKTTIEAVMSGNTLEYHRLNEAGDRVEIANDEGYGLLMVEKDENHNFVYGGKTIDKTHYVTAKQFFGLLKSLAKFNYIAHHGLLA
jgi:hypothetical protein